MAAPRPSLRGQLVGAMATGATSSAAQQPKVRYTHRFAGVCWGGGLGDRVGAAAPAAQTAAPNSWAAATAARCCCTARSTPLLVPATQPPWLFCSACASLMHPDAPLTLCTLLKNTHKPSRAASLAVCGRSTRCPFLLRPPPHPPRSPLRARLNVLTLPGRCYRWAGGCAMYKKRHTHTAPTHAHLISTARRVALCNT